jgi:hypothetical protein
MYTHLLTTRLLTGASLAGSGVSYSLNVASLGVGGLAFQNAINQDLGVQSFASTAYAINLIAPVSYDLGFALFKNKANSLRVPVVLSLDLATTDLMAFKLRTDGYLGTVNDMLYGFFGSGGAISLQDAEKLWLVSKTGVSVGSSQDLWVIYLNNIGYSGTLDDMMKQYWYEY